MRGLESGLVLRLKGAGGTGEAAAAKWFNTTGDNLFFSGLIIHRRYRNQHETHPCTHAHCRCICPTFIRGGGGGGARSYDFRFTRASRSDASLESENQSQPSMPS